MPRIGMNELKDMMHEMKSKFEKKQYHSIDIQSDSTDSTFSECTDSDDDDDDDIFSISEEIERNIRSGPLMAKYIKTKHRCKCGSNLILVNDPNTDIYRGDSAVCDRCHRDIPRNEQFYHCQRIGD